MTLFVLDTDILTLFQQGHVLVRAQIASHKPEDIAVTVLSVEEQLSGWYTYLRKAKDIDKLAWAYQRLTDTATSLAAFKILTFDEPSIRRYDSLRIRKLPVRKMDLESPPSFWRKARRSSREM
jgi:tRNA(fMet)-specific endonuclease VapC